MNLGILLDGLVNDSSALDRTIEVKGIALDSRKVKAGFAFIAVAGAIEHGLVYAQQAMENGASIIIYETRGSDAFALDELDCYQIAVNDLGAKLGDIANRFYQSPSRSLDVIGITGTNGKTSCSQFLAQVIPESGVIGTLGWGEEGALKQMINTTPDALAVQEMLAEFVSQRKQVVVMEVSSHGLQQGRVNEVSFKGAVFTNLSRDHLDYHGSMEQYLRAKLVLFTQPELQFVVVNTDDETAERFLAVVDKKVKRWAFSVTGNSSQLAENVRAEGVDFSLQGIEFFVCWRNEKVRIQTRIVGDFNLENILAVITVLLAQGYPLENAANKISELVSVSGRMERFGGGGKPFVFVDYAHTPDALEKVLLGLKKYQKQTVWLVFGCGGNRDKGKRAQMGVIAERLAEQVIITNDNPRFEDAEHIVNDILTHCSGNNIEVILDREKAIRTVIKKADINDCIVIAGKGHEDYQDVRGVKHRFSDQSIVRHALLERDA
jgi:UDP-N-acetylmuramoyl-L-alanyl-D-glutamate--2,6-diaminopimelate ligase